MKKNVILFLAICSSVFAIAQDKTPYMVKNISVNIQEVELTTSGGSIQVLHENGAQQRLEVYVRGNNNQNLSKAEIEQRLKDDYELTIETSGSKLVAMARRTANNNNWKNSLSISFKVYAPEKINSELLTSGGSINLSGLDGSHDFKTSGGSLSLKGMRGKLQGATSGGSINIEEINATAEMSTSGGSINAKTCKDNLNLTTSGGSINLEELNGTVHVATSGGSISANNIGGELKASTSGGSINAKGMHCNLDAATSGGSVNVAMDALKEYVKLGNSSGNINLSIPAGSKVNIDLHGQRVSVPNLTNFSGNTSDKEIKGTVNGGGALIKASASSGNVSVRFE